MVLNHLHWHGTRWDESVWYDYQGTPCLKPDVLGRLLWHTAQRTGVRWQDVCATFSLDTSPGFALSPTA